MLKNPALASHLAAARAGSASGSIAITSRGKELGALHPVVGALAPTTLASLSDWRNLHRSAFFSERVATPDSTARWLESIASRDNRVLFLIKSAPDAIVGHIGLNHVDESKGLAETDAWLGVGDKRAPGIMFLAFVTLVQWSFAHLGVRQLNAQVFSDNTKVIRAHEMMGFRLAHTENFVRREDDGGVWWERGMGDAVREVSHLQLRPADFEPRLHAWR